jgi:hypothetical protein
MRCVGCGLELCARSDAGGDENGRASADLLGVGRRNIVLVGLGRPSNWRGDDDNRREAVGERRLRLILRIAHTTVLFLLTLRMLAAPLAVRPETPKSPNAFRLATRVCAWPVERPQRSSARLHRSLSPTPDNEPIGQFADDSNRRSTMEMSLRLTRASLALRNSPTPPGASAGQLSDRMRC